MYGKIELKKAALEIFYMKLGAQMYSVRTECTDAKSLRNTFLKLKEIGYESAQLSGTYDVDAEIVKSCILESGLVIPATHRNPENVLNFTEKEIDFHKTIGASLIGIGSMPPRYRESVEGVRQFIKDMREPIKKIGDAGLKFTYHNHSWEFAPLEGTCIYDVLIEEAPEMEFMHDVYWSRYAGVDTIGYLKRICEAGRVTDIHFKDMKKAANGPLSMCPCGEGIIDFTELVALCESYGVKNAYIEQDNAPDLGDVFAQMKTSFDNLFPIFKAYR